MTHPARHGTGPRAVITALDLDRTAVLAGESVTVGWRTRGASLICITRPDGDTVELDARSGRGSYRFTATMTGAVRAVAYDRSDASPEWVRPVAVFELPETVAVGIPDLRNIPMPVFGRTGPVIPDANGVAAAFLAARPRDLRLGQRMETLIASGPPGVPPPPLGLLPDRFHPAPWLTGPLTEPRRPSRLRAWLLRRGDDG
ncbi:hypothetical protein [Actinokineospora fastidiosa]|uniref:Uncharacterized protein n=1 Tax=Actinokineospora fastidiosa TaxID=1816 RepID=A0A918GQI1_9PSEU|nr:hypothetical protein [Actinokineospora fastidiosa]GGS54746.1 hypothetical protein GCM10010171_57370 [Actinokineospora fastidiosa]